jgi:hypothetical protein
MLATALSCGAVSLLGCNNEGNGGDWWGNKDNNTPQSGSDTRSNYNRGTYNNTSGNRTSPDTGGNYRPNDNMNGGANTGGGTSETNR